MNTVLEMPDDVVESLLSVIETNLNERSVVLTFVNPSSQETFQLRCRDVREMRLTDVTLQNILQEVVVYGRGGDPEIVRPLLSTVMFGNDNPLDIDPVLRVHVRSLDERLQDVLNGRALLIAIEAVYGAWGGLVVGTAEWLRSYNPQTP